jgi:archaeal chaperonin
MDKMICDSLGDFIVTNDGATILKHLPIANAAAKVMVELALAQDVIYTTIHIDCF